MQRDLDSLDEDERAEVVFQLGQILDAFDVEGKQRGQKRGPLGYIAIRVWGTIAEAGGLGGKPVTMTITELATTTGHSNGAITDGIKRLQAHDFIEVTETKNAGERAGRRAHTYQLKMPPAATEAHEKREQRYEEYARQQGAF